jgi:hypothetical protein
VSEIVSLRDVGRALQQFEPQKSAMKLDALKGVKEHATRIRDWETLSRAVDAETEEQRLFVGWWTANVRRPGQGRNNADRHYFSVDEVERETGITQPLVSKWRKWLGDVEDYREKLRGPSWRKAMGGRDETEQRVSGSRPRSSSDRAQRLSRHRLLDILNMSI